VAIKRGEISAQISEIEELTNAAKQMTGRNVVLKVERENKRFWLPLFCPII